MAATPKSSIGELVIASQAGDIRAVQGLLDAGCDVNGMDEVRDDVMSPFSSFSSLGICSFAAFSFISPLLRPSCSAC
jgi:hypothetical protein